MIYRNLSKVFLFLLIFILIGFIANVSAVRAGDESKEKSSKPDHDAMMEKWKEFATPNENHKLLDALVGNWDYTIKWWMSPDGEPEVSKGISEIQWIMGARFIQHKVQGTSMEQPFEGMGIMGYDNEKKEYQSVWIDNMGTGIVKGTGNFDPDTKTLIEQGTFSCPAEGEKSYRGVTKIIDRDHFTYEWYMAGPDGKEFRAMEIVYNRKK